MARRFLTPIDLNKLELQNARIQNLSSDPASPVAGQIYYNSVDAQLKYYNGSASAWQVIGQSIEQLEDAVADLLTAGSGIFLDYNDGTGTLTIANTGVTSVLGTANEVEVSASAGAVTISLPGTINASTTGNANTATTLATARTISLGGDLSGSASFNGSTDITINATVGANSVALGTDTTGDYVAGATAGTGINVSGSGGEGSTLTISNTGVTSVTGTANEVTVSASAGAVTIGLPDDVTIGGSLVVTGDLTVSGSTTYLNTATLQVEDNKVVLNSGATGTPTIDAGIEVERGDAPNAELFWDESEGKWTASNGSASYALSLVGHTHTSSDITNFQEAVEDVVGAMATDSGTVDLTYTDNGAGAGTLSASVILAASASYLSTTSGLAVDKISLGSALITDGFSRKVSANLTGSATSYAITHNLGTRDVTVNVYDNATYETVETDIVRTDSNTVTVSFAVAPTSNAYRVVIVG
jgi:hypothetical protein